MARKKDNESFENLLEETENLVNDLESGELSLDESLKKYEKGIENLRKCNKLISLAEEKVKLILEETSGEFQLNDLDTGAEDPEEEEE